MYRRIVIPIYWDNSNANVTRIHLENLEQLNEQYLSKGWEIERVDEFHGDFRNVLMYILRKEKDETEMEKQSV